MPINTSGCVLTESHPKTARLADAKIPGPWHGNNWNSMIGCVIRLQTAAETNAEASPKTSLIRHAVVMLSSSPRFWDLEVNRPKVFQCYGTQSSADLHSGVP